ncbi:MAG: DUF4349 domain-containing protein [Isosphaeraceae bacterium]
MRAPKMLTALTLLASLGCSEAQMPRYAVESAKTATRAYAPATTSPDGAAPPPAAEPADRRSAPSPAAAGLAGMMSTAIQAQGAPAGFSRKIIYDGDISLVVKDVDAVGKQVVKVVLDARGYIAEYSTTGSPGSQRSMRWKLRIPVEQFDAVVENVASLGELERNTRTSQDVTEQFYDIEARIKNKKAEEKSLTKILDERTGKLEDILKIEGELSRVRGEIEQLEGRIRVLENLSSLATLVVSVREREKFEPPPPAAADFPTQVARTWENSVKGLVNLGKGVILWAVEWAIWIPLLIVAALIALLVLRWLYRRLPRLIAILTTPLTPPRGS